MKYYLYTLISFTYGIIQSFVGLIMFIRFKLQNRIVKWYFYKGSVVIFIKHFNGVSMGFFIFLNKWYLKEKNNKTVKHEYGHFLQNLIFGFLYLIIIGIPSLRNNLLSRKNIYIRHNYYNLYPERWADKLGNVRRDI